MRYLLRPLVSQPQSVKYQTASVPNRTFRNRSEFVTTNTEQCGSLNKLQ